MIYEIREYTTVPGRMPALVKRFKNREARAASEADGAIVATIGRRVLNPGVFA